MHGGALASHTSGVTAELRLHWDSCSLALCSLRASARSSGSAMAATPAGVRRHSCHFLPGFFEQ